MKKMLLFQVGTRPYGIDLARVKSIQRVKHIVDEEPESSKQITRVFDDKQTQLYDLVTIFEKGSGGRDVENEKLIIAEAEGYSMGMIVSRVDQVVSVDTDRIKPLSPLFKGASMSCFPNILQHEDALILLLAPEGIEKVFQEAAKVQNVTSRSGSEDSCPDAEEIITLVNEVSTVSDYGPMSLVGRWTQDSDIYEALQTAETNPEFRPPAEDIEIVDMISEVIDTADIDDESQCETTSFLANLLQTDRDSSSQADPTGFK
jgi:chemotaxis signal transduction protein